jgi:hypothetical protein
MLVDANMRDYGLLTSQGWPMDEDEFSDADRNDLLREHLRTLADWFDAGRDSPAGDAMADGVRIEAQAAQDSYLRARKVPPGDH